MNLINTKMNTSKLGGHFIIIYLKINKSILSVTQGNIIFKVKYKIKST